MALNQCKVTKVKKGDITVHVFTSPEEGEMVNSQIVETPNAVVMIDVPLLKPYAQEHRQYIEGIGKPIQKIFASHAHPDHWFCLSHFKDHKIFAFKETIDQMKMLKDLAINYHKSLHAELMPDEVILPTDTINEGAIRIDGITFNLYKLINAEDNAMMVIDIPSINTLLPQDLVYNKCYMYVATKTQDGKFTIDTWINYLKEFKKKGYETIIPGHGRPTDSSIFDENIAYLTFAKKVIESAKDGKEFISRFKSKYPDYQIELVLTMSEFMIYQFGKG